MTDYLLGTYKIEIADPDNSKVAELVDWRSLIISHKINDPGSLTLRFGAFGDTQDLFQINSRIRVLRSIPGSVAWYTEWEGFAETLLEQIFQNGDRSFTCYGSGYATMLARRIIMWYKASSEANKSATPAQTAMYEYVLENCGSYATVANGRLFAGAFDDFNMAAGTGSGANWSGDRSFRNLLTTLQEIANWSEIDFDVVGDGDGWLFETYPDQRGEDRTTIGLDSSTGLNGAGNAPVIFSVENGNVASISRTISHRNSINTVIALGTQQDAARNYEVETNETARTLNTGRLNQREAARNASQQGGTASELTVVAEEWLEKKQPQESISFVPQRAESTLYGRDFWWADRITARFEGTDYQKRLIEVKIKVDRATETFASWKFEDVPTS